MRILFLACKMSRGFGVSVVVAELVRRLNAVGCFAMVGCQDTDRTFEDIQVVVLPPTAEKVRETATSFGITHIMAHTTPYFEMLPELTQDFRCWAWENGDPTAALFPHDREERENIINNKIRNVYHCMEGVIGISRFIIHDIQWPAAKLIYYGCDHVQDRGTKTIAEISEQSKPLKVGTLFRLGEGEANYKGNQLFVDLCQRCRLQKMSVQFFVMGRGTDADAELFRQQGIEVLLNASDDERDTYLRSLDVFFTPSMWEGFNLPLVEAQAMGTLAIALDIGAHPEVTPFLAKNIDAVAKMLGNYEKNREILLEHSKIAYFFVRNKFRWDQTGWQLLTLLARSNPVQGAWGQKYTSKAKSLRGIKVSKKAWKILREKGPKVLWHKIKSRIFQGN